MVQQQTPPHQWQYPQTDARVTTTQADHGNLWNAAVVGAGGVSAGVLVPRDIQSGAVFGNASAATTISLRLSANGSAYFTVAQATVGAAGDFAFTNLQLPGGVQLLLQSSGAATITATALVKT